MIHLVIVANIGRMNDKQLPNFDKNECEYLLYIMFLNIYLCDLLIEIIALKGISLSQFIKELVEVNGVFGERWVII